MDAENLPPAALAEPQMSLASDSSSVLHQASKSNRSRRARANSWNALSGEKKTKRKRAGEQQEAEASSSRKPNRAKRVFNEDDGLLILNQGLDPSGMLKELYPFLKERLDGDFARTQIKMKVLGLKKSYFEEEEEKDLGGESDEEGEYVFLRGALKILETLGMPRILDDGLAFIERGDAKELNLLWRELLIEELRVYIHRLELLKETTLKILDGMNKDSIN